MRNVNVNLYGARSFFPTQTDDIAKGSFGLISYREGSLLDCMENIALNTNGVPCRGIRKIDNLHCTKPLCFFSRKIITARNIRPFSRIWTSKRMLLPKLDESTEDELFTWYFSITTQSWSFCHHQAAVDNNRRTFLIRFGWRPRITCLWRTSLKRILKLHERPEYRHRGSFTTAKLIKRWEIISFELCGTQISVSFARRLTNAVGRVTRIIFSKKKVTVFVRQMHEETR